MCGTPPYGGGDPTRSHRGHGEQPRPGKFPKQTVLGHDFRIPTRPRWQTRVWVLPRQQPAIFVRSASSGGPLRRSCLLNQALGEPLNSCSRSLLRCAPGCGNGRVRETLTLRPEGDLACLLNPFRPTIRNRQRRCPTLGHYRRTIQNRRPLIPARQIRPHRIPTEGA